MPSSILMPALSPTMTQGYLVKWHKDVGQPVRSGDVLMEVETDKAVMEVEATQEGVLDHILVGACSQTMVQVGQVVAVLRHANEPEGIGRTHLTAQGQGASPAADQGPANKDGAPQDPPQTAMSGQSSMPAPGQATPQGACEPTDQPKPRQDTGGRILASPLARVIAQQASLDLTRVTGSGPGGRIVKRDVEQALATPQPGAPQANLQPLNASANAGATVPSTPQTASASAPRGAPIALVGTPAEGTAVAPTLLPISGMRRVIAQRLTQSKQTIPHFTLTVSCVMDALLALRGQMNAKEKRFSVNDFLVRACALALWDVPEMRTLWDEQHLIRHNTVDLAVAVSIPGGLLTPIVTSAERKPLALLAPEIKDLAAQARAGTLPAKAYQGGTFTLSNLGMYGIESFTPIINPPQSGILAIGNTVAQPWVDEKGQVCVRQVLRASVCADHRSVDGQDAARFLTRFQDYVQNPHLLLC